MRLAWCGLAAVLAAAPVLGSPVVNVVAVPDDDVFAVDGRMTIRVMASVSGAGSATDGLFSYDVGVELDTQGVVAVQAGSVVQPNVDSPYHPGTIDANGIAQCYGTYFYEQTHGLGQAWELFRFTVQGLAFGQVTVGVSPDDLVGDDFLLHESPTCAVDYSAASVTLTVALPGDADVDGDVDFLDYIAFKRHYGMVGQPKWRDCNFDGDAIVGRADFLGLKENFGTSAPYGGPPLLGGGEPIPEPATLSLLALAGLALAWRGAQPRR